jgi:hypothetical protein
MQRIAQSVQYTVHGTSLAKSKWIRRVKNVDKCNGWYGVLLFYLIIYFYTCRISKHVPTSVLIVSVLYYVAFTDYVMEACFHD